MEQFIILIIIALVSMLFNRKKVSQQREQQSPVQPQQRPTTGQPVQTRSNRYEGEVATPTQRQGFPDLGKARSLQEAAEILVTTIQSPPEIKKVIEETKEDVGRKAAELKRQEELLRKQAEMISKRASYIKTKSESKSTQFNNNDILNGIIMAEVLGPPRSIKPYKRSSR